MADSTALSLWIRKRLPSPVRRVARLGRLALKRGSASVQVPAELFADCRVCASRYDLVERLPHGGRIAEVGTLRGHFAKHILERSAPSELHLIDLDFSEVVPVVRDHPRVRMHRGHSRAVLMGFPDSSFDWIYVDGDHSYDGVLGDADAAAAKVRPGGFLVFNDFAHMDPFLGAYGVHRAVVDFAVSRRWPFRWLAYEGSALYDVALQRPSSAT